jgi:flagellar biosynthesis protein FlhF
VLSAASGARELRAAARRYERCGVHRVIFSKLDEADGPASVSPGTSVIARPISCVTDGQRVPEDVHPGSSPRLLEMVLGR